MGRIAGTIWRPLPENETQPLIRPTQWIVHTAVDGPGPTNLGDYFHRADVNLESHTWLRWDRHEQLMDTERRADANYLANRRPDGTGAVSTETEDDGTPVERPWNAYQLGELIRTGVELHRMHGIPAVLAPAWDAPGMGYHSLYPQHWTNVAGKTCPGSTRIKQFKDIVLPGIQRALDQGDDDMKPFFARYKGTDAIYVVDASLQSKHHIPSPTTFAGYRDFFAINGWNTEVLEFEKGTPLGLMLQDIPTIPPPVAPASGTTAAAVAAEFAKRLAT